MSEVTLVPPVWRARTRMPRQNSCAMLAMVNAMRPKLMSVIGSRTRSWKIEVSTRVIGRKIASAATVAIITANGKVNCPIRRSRVVRR